MEAVTSAFYDVKCIEEEEECFLGVPELTREFSSNIQSAVAEPIIYRVFTKEWCGF